MPTRRACLLAAGTLATLGGCTAPSATQDSPTTNEATSEAAGEAESEPSNEPPQEPTAAVRRFYRGLLGENIAALNSTLVHPASPTYPVEPDHLPPAAFQDFSRAVLDSVEAVSPQSWAVQRLYPNVTETIEMKRAMSVDDYQLVHTTFYLKKPDEERAYEAETVDYTVEDDGQWYVRYNASRKVHGQASASRTPVTNETS